MRNDRIESCLQPPTPVPLVHVLVEDRVVACAQPDLVVPEGFSVTTCSGPFSASEPCPLVLEAECPHGLPDVVVHTLAGPWASSVRAAWAETGVSLVDGTDEGTAQERMDRAIGAALGAAHREHQR